MAAASITKSFFMEEVLRSSTLRLAKKNMSAYLKTHDPKYVAEDAVYINTSSGEKAVGRQAIAKMLDYFYRTAFDAYPKITSRIITEDKAMIEGFFIGKHIGDFWGVRPTGKIVTVPFFVSYTLKDGLIKEARIFLPGDMLLHQLQN
jgi:predicted ester cyclase